MNPEKLPESLESPAEEEQRLRVEAAFERIAYECDMANQEKGVWWKEELRPKIRILMFCVGGASLFGLLFGILAWNSTEESMERKYANLKFTPFVIPAVNARATPVKVVQPPNSSKKVAAQNAYEYVESSDMKIIRQNLDKLSSSINALRELNGESSAKEK
jgi:hypothetical protein